MDFSKRFGVSSDKNGIWWIVAGIVATIAAVVGREYLPQRSVDLLVPGSHVRFISNDPADPWASRVQWIDEREHHFRCSYTAQDNFARSPCSVTFLLGHDADQNRGVDLRRFESLHLDLVYQGTSRFVRVGVRNFDPRFSSVSDGNSARLQSASLRARDVAAPLTMKLSELTVPEWWIAQYNLPREFNIANLDNAVSVTIDLPEQLAARQDLRIRGLRLQGQWIQRETLYFAILCVWILGALGTFGWRFAGLRRRHLQQQLEIEALHRRTARLRAEQVGLKRLAAVDKLTGVLNRHGIEELFVSEGSHDRDIALLVLDIDHFKRVNDTHGHDTGDLVLQHVAAVIAENIRAGDLVGRWGGEEFLVACMDCAPQHAVIVAENIRQRIEASPFGSRHRIAVTASLGASMMRAGDSLNSAFRRADAAMYRAKAMGRNRTVFDDEAARVPESAMSE